MIRQNEEALMRLPNVTGVGLGEKAGKPAIMVLVTRKVPESSLRPQDIVPTALGGYETDVVETGALEAQGL